MAAHSKPDPVAEEHDLDAQLLAVVELRALLLDDPAALTGSGARNRLQRIREIASLVLEAAERALVSADLQDDGPLPVDDWIDDYTNPHIYARFWLHHARLPAMLQQAFKPIMGNIKLFCSWRGKRYRVSGASTWGDIWLNRDFDKDYGHDERVAVTECYAWSDRPDEPTNFPRHSVTGHGAGCNCAGCNSSNSSNGPDPQEEPRPSGEGEHGLSWKVPLWDAINAYVATCGGDASKHVYGNTRRMRLVVAIEQIVRESSGAPK
jgi:hypothetical protein